MEKQPHSSGSTSRMGHHPDFNFLVAATHYPLPNTSSSFFPFQQLCLCTSAGVTPVDPWRFPKPPFSFLPSVALENSSAVRKWFTDLRGGWRQLRTAACHFENRSWLRFLPGMSTESFQSDFLLLIRFRKHFWNPIIRENRLAWGRANEYEAVWTLKNKLLPFGRKEGVQTASGRTSGHAGHAGNGHCCICLCFVLKDSTWPPLTRQIREIMQTVAYLGFSRWRRPLILL